jgi:hypothetical protein
MECRLWVSWPGGFPTSASVYSSTWMRRRLMINTLQQLTGMEWSQDKLGRDSNREHSEGD